MSSRTFCLLLLFIPAVSHAQTHPASEAEVLPTLVIESESQSENRVSGPFLSDFQGARINIGKKTSVVDFDTLPQIQSDNYRQAFALTPGLLTSELPNPSLLSLGYRGIGDPHESQNFLVLKDGVPFVLDLIGYPTVYYAPPFESLDRLEFVRGGAALQYGPQPSGTLNYITHTPDRTEPLQLTTQHIVGSKNLYTTFNTLEGGNEHTGYMLQYDHRQGDSFRKQNGDYSVEGVTGKIIHHFSNRSRITLNLDISHADSGEPGGLTFTPGTGALLYQNDRHQTQTLFDRVRVDRRAGSIAFEQVFENKSILSLRTWTGDVDRFSKRQTGVAFGKTPTGTTNTITLHRYRFGGVDARFRKNLCECGDLRPETVLSIGFTGYASQAPFSVRTGATPDAEDGAFSQRSDRRTRYAAAFSEAAFTWGKFALVPGIRIESINQRIRELQNNAKTAANNTLANTMSSDTVPLVGIGTNYLFSKSAELYANSSQAYKPKTFTDAVPLGANDTIAGDLDPAHTWTHEIGVRGRIGEGTLTYDASLFHIDYRDRFGRVGNTIQNVGRSINKGIDLAAQLDLFRLGKTPPTDSQLILYANASLLDAEFTQGPLIGKTPQYAPSTMLRAGVIFRKYNFRKVALSATHLSNHYADDANSANFFIPAYTVVDLTGEFSLTKKLQLVTGINNLLDEDYYSRIRSAGIDPAIGRNFYAGLRMNF